ncbi:peptide chain release factor N(5)-glutamine methyltransferase [Microbacterium sp. VKM Ac-2870]|uniref:peptide chain release factor N(5)-glutamine methyltransferase n=1 Tax=Microbacterium sp. VKM Ac-2870 TaxID=2783825 RepID=UPI00188BB940|nr:peptide chain release factor N(5)-glutamine methyltransferase [Microbacterium sp. VKM Ac-2870]MBF4561795.1 peptide chain release factor N(5)-glutamine methyltransferase [Microbacterium sp. VKM Ac-2870]
MTSLHESGTPSRPASAGLSALLRRATQVLADAGVPTPDVDAELLAAHLWGISRGQLLAAALRGDAAPGDTAAFDALIARRASREPLQHLTGTAPFRHLELRVGPGVFVPRPETEMVAQLAIDALRAVPDAAPVAVDLGTGSGALALAMATEVPYARVHAAENAVDAFVWAKENFAAVAPHAVLAFVDLADAFPELDGTVSVLVSNPPYVPDAATPRDPEVRNWDPPSALYGGEDGLDVVRVLSGVGLRLLRPGGTLVIEHGEWQGAPIRALLDADGWRATATHRDLTVRDRATTAIRP